MPLHSLQGKRIVITRSITADKAWEDYLEKNGATVYSFPTIETIPVGMTPELMSAIDAINHFDWIVFTSAQGIYAFESIIKNSGLAIDRHELPPVGVIGDATASVARSAGYMIAFQPSQANSIALARELEPVEKKSILLLRTNAASSELPELLTLRGAIITNIPIYSTVPMQKPCDQAFLNLLEEQKIQYVIFASPSAVKGFMQRIPKVFHDRARQLPVVAIGPSLSSILKQHGFNNVKIAKEPTIKGLVSAMV